MGRVVSWEAYGRVRFRSEYVRTREQGRDGFKSTRLSALLDTASEQLVGWPWETSAVEKTACWTVPK